MGILCAATARAEVYTGMCGPTLKWYLDSESGVLSFSGYGVMDDYTLVEGENTAPWRKYADMIRSVDFSLRQNNIGAAAFAYCRHIEYLSFPMTLRMIGPQAFVGCDGLRKVVLTKGKTMQTPTSFPATVPIVPR